MWCRSAQCVFMMVDGSNFSKAVQGMRIVSLAPPQHPTAAQCCEKEQGDFCLPQWKVKLDAQYAFLPALLWAKQRIAAAAHTRADHNHGIGPDVKWVALVDDDSYVFPQRFFKLLGWHDPTSEALYMGDFLVRYPGSRPSDFACGGSGSIFSFAHCTLCV